MQAQEDWQTYTLYGLTLSSNVSFTTPLLTAAGLPDVTFTYAADPPCIVDWQTLTSVYATARPDNGQPFCTCYRLDSCEVLRFADGTDFYLWPRHIICHLLDPTQRSQAELHLLGTVLAYWNERRGVAMLHASAIVTLAGAVAFVAISQGGKSALAAALMVAGYSLLSDDMLPVAADGERFLAYPGYPQMRMWPEQAQHFVGNYQTLELVHPNFTKYRVPIGPAGWGMFCPLPQPLSALYLLDRRSPTEDTTNIKIAAVSSAQALFALVGHSFAARLINGVAHQRQRIACLTSLVRHIPVRCLSYPSGYEHLPFVRQAIFADLEGLA
jgi:hypothetical protein